MNLELRIPPPLVALLVAAAMAGIAALTAAVELPPLARRLTSLAVALGGGAIAVAGAALFRCRGTTVNPLRPDKASVLVTGGIYRVTRNPMYLGLAVVLLGWALFLATPLSLVGVPLFMLYIERFQIAPEERSLEVLFGADYLAYRARVRRWI